jgi:hypothetical protein
VKEMELKNDLYDYLDDEDYQAVTCYKQQFVLKFKVNGRKRLKKQNKQKNRNTYSQVNSEILL